MRQALKPFKQYADERLDQECFWDLR